MFYSVLGAIILLLGYMPRGALGLATQTMSQRETVKVLVLGSSGRLGREVVRELSALSSDFKTSSRGKVYPPPTPALVSPPLR